MKRLIYFVTFLGLVAATGAYAQVSSINSAVITSRVFNDIPGATFTSVNGFFTSLSEAGVSRPAPGGANRDIWRFSNNGSTAYQLQSGNYFNASFNLTLTGSGTPGIGLEAGWLLSNPSGN